jgi:hypothetical protein
LECRLTQERYYLFSQSEREREKASLQCH